MGKKKTRMAVCYDFDGTLAPGYMQEHSLLPALRLKSQKFWEEVKNLSKEHNMNEILAYMFLTLKKADEVKHPIKRDSFKQHGKSIKLFEGLKDFFDEMSDYASSKNLEMEHYIISSGLKEIIEGTEIYRKFRYVFASEFYYDENGVARWPAVAIDYTSKTQYLFRINKGIINVWDNARINQYVPELERKIPFTRIVYIGDGETDIPCMKIVNLQGWYSVAVYDPKKRKSKNKISPHHVCLHLIKHGRTKYIAPANYEKDSKLSKILKLIIDRISAEESLKMTLPKTR